MTMKDEPIISVAGLTHWVCSEGPLCGRPSVRLKVGRDGTQDMCPTEIMTWITSRNMPYRLMITGDAPSQPLGSLIHRAQGRGYCVCMISDGCDVADWFATLDHIILMPQPTSNGDLPDLKHLLETSAMGNTYTTVSFHIVVKDSVDYEFARKVHDYHPSIDMYLAATGSSDIDAEGWPDALQRLTQRVIDNRWNDVWVIPHLGQAL